MRLYQYWGGEITSRFPAIYRPDPYARPRIPWYYGLSHEMMEYAVNVYYPIPINYLVRCCMAVFKRFIRVCFWLNLVDIQVGEAFYWGAFWRIRSKR